MENDGKIGKRRKNADVSYEGKKEEEKHEKLSYYDDLSTSPTDDS